MTTPTKRSDDLLARFSEAQSAKPTSVGIAGAGTEPQNRGSADLEGNQPQTDSGPSSTPGATTGAQGGEPPATSAPPPLTRTETQSPVVPPAKTVPVPATTPAVTIPIPKKATTSLGTTYFTDDLEAVNEIVHALVSRHKLKHPLRAKIGHSVVVGAIVHSVLPTWESDPDSIVAMVNTYFHELAPTDPGNAEP